ncbi:MAG: hypothetical protein ACP5VR_12605 [Acidimicrobiales bacterium]
MSSSGEAFQAACTLDEISNRTAGEVLGLDQDRARCHSLAERYRQLSAQTADDYPSLAACAAQLCQLFTKLGATLGSLSAHAEELAACTGQLADLLAGRE